MAKRADADSAADRITALEAEVARLQARVCDQRHILDERMAELDAARTAQAQAERHAEHYQDAIAEIADKLQQAERRARALAAALERHECGAGQPNHNTVWCGEHKHYHCPAIDQALDAARRAT